MGLADDIAGSYPEPDADDAPPTGDKAGGDDKEALACVADMRRAWDAKDNKAYLAAFRSLIDEVG